MKEDTFTSRLRNSALVSLGRFRRAKYFGIVPNLEQKKWATVVVRFVFIETTTTTKKKMLLYFCYDFAGGSRCQLSLGQSGQRKAPYVLLFIWKSASGKNSDFLISFLFVSTLH